MRGTKQSSKIRDCHALRARNDNGNVKKLNAFVLETKGSEDLRNGFVTEGLKN